MSVSRQDADIEALIRAAELSVADRDARVRREVYQMRQRLQHDGSRWVVTGAVVGVAVLGFRALWRSMGAGNGKAVNGAVNGHVRRGSGVGDRDAARQFAWVGPVALTLLRSPIVSTWLARHLWHRRETRAGASPSASPSAAPSASPSNLPPAGPALDPDTGESR
jgi:hypothetical protein